MSKRKHIHILATGGTIAGAADSAVQTTGYRTATLGVEAMLASVPHLEALARISAEQFLQIASADMDVPAWLALAARVNALLAAEGDEAVDGVVITHGTDTLEETAYFLNLTVASSKPVVLVGAMRPATALSADGPLNLYNAVLVAAHAATQGKGVVVVMDDAIYAARHVQKTSTFHTHSFKGLEYGCLGTVEGGVVDYAYAPLKIHTTRSLFARPLPPSLPKVEIVYAYAGCGAGMMEAALAQGAQGLVLACTGNGAFNAAMREFVGRHAGQCVFVRASRIPSGAIAPNGEENDDLFGTVPAADLSPQKARILLMLALSAGMEGLAIVPLFTHY
jgi:L-asparaginase